MSDLFTCFETVEIRNDAGVPPGDMLLVRSKKGKIVPVQMPYVLKGERFKIRIPLDDFIVNGNPTRIILRADSRLTNTSSVMWARRPKVSKPAAPKSSTV